MFLVIPTTRSEITHDSALTVVERCLNSYCRVQGAARPLDSCVGARSQDVGISGNPIPSAW